MASGQLTTTTPSRVATVRDLLNKTKEQIAAALPKHMTPERMIRVAMTALQKPPAYPGAKCLMDCDPRTVVARVVEASQLGLEPDGILGHAYLIPFNNKKNGTVECQLIPGYKGLVELARRSGQVSTIYAKVVHANDNYKVKYGLKPDIEHEPADGEPGDMVAVYAVCQLRDGGVQFEWMWKREVDAIRSRSRAKDSGPWVTDYEAMAKKTVLRQLCKLLPVSVEAQRFIAKDELFDADVDTDDEPRKTKPRAIDLLESTAEPAPAPAPESTVEEIADHFGEPDPTPETPPQTHQDSPQQALDPLAVIKSKIDNCPAASALNNLANSLCAERDAGLLDELQFGQVEAWLAERRKALSPRGERAPKGKANGTLLDQ